MVKTYKNLFSCLYSYNNLEVAFGKVKERKSKKRYIIDFEKNLEENLKQLSLELKTQIYSPRSLTTFIIRDPKTRKISASDFRDRIVHHALINILGSIFEKTFIYDSHANQKYKGTSGALKRFDYFKRKVSEKPKVDSWKYKSGHIFKADIKRYFWEVNHMILFNIIKRKIKDKEVILLIKKILKNHNSTILGKGMPLGNLTSQFFANVYLNELDYFVKHTLKARYYIRYVDDFVIFHKNKTVLLYYKDEISKFLKKELKLELHPEKTKIFPLFKGVTFLGFRVFYFYKLLKKSNHRRILKRVEEFKEYSENEFSKKKILLSISGWEGYCKIGGKGTYNLRKNLKKEINWVYK